VSGIDEFRNIHAGEIMMLVGNSENLYQTPPERFAYPSIGMNTIHLYNGWSPSYYVAVDRRVMREFGDAIVERFAGIPKFIPKPKLTRWRGPNFYRFHNRPGPLYSRKNGKLWQDDISKAELTYINVMHVAIKLAYFMGAGTILIIGMQHKPGNANAHFWGTDTGIKCDGPIAEIFDGYRQLSAELQRRGVQIYNLSQDTYVPGEIIPQDDWETWVTKPEKE
jgi:hypothetical protein